MDFNDIQSAWKNENTENVTLPTHLDKINSANMPLEKIKKNFRKEFFYQIIAIIFIGFVPIIYNIPATAIAPFYLLFSIFVLHRGALIRPSGESSPKPAYVSAAVSKAEYASEYAPV